MLPWGSITNEGCCTFVVSQSEVEVAGNGCIKGKIKKVPIWRFILIHRADGLDHLETRGTQKRHLTSVTSLTGWLGVNSSYKLFNVSMQ